MTLDAKPPNPQRDQTDESLRVEREVVDLALGDDELAAIDDTADAVSARCSALANLPR